MNPCQTNSIRCRTCGNHFTEDNPRSSMNLHECVLCATGVQLDPSPSVAPQGRWDQPPAAINFALAYRRYLDRSEPSLREPQEPNPEDYGMAKDLGESIAKAVHWDWEQDQISKAKALGKEKGTLKG